MLEATRHRPARRSVRAFSVAAAGALVMTGVTALPSAADDPPTPVVHYEFEDDPGGGVIADVSGNDLHGALVNGGTAESEETDDGHALRLPGGQPSTGAYVELPAGVLAGATDLTVSARVSWDGTGGAWQWLYALGTDNGRYLFTTPSNDTSQLRTAITVGGGNAESRVTGPAALPAQEWRTVTVTLDSGAGLLATYLDGVLVHRADTDIEIGDIIDSDASGSGYIGRSFYADPLFAGAIDDFQVFHEALSAEEVGEFVDADLPEIIELESQEFETTTFVGELPELPELARASFSDGYDRYVPIEWEAVNEDQVAQPGSFTVSGSAAGTAVTATVRVITEGLLTVDLGTDTGEFLGGASGLLYGLYADGMPTDNLIEGMGVRTVATKAQDGAQHPGSDALEVVRPLADATDGDVYVRTTDYYRGFPYQWPGDTPEERLSGYLAELERQVAQIAEFDPDYLDNIVIEPFNEPEGNMFGTGEWSYDGTSWLEDPADYFAAWDAAHEIIRAELPDVRISGPNTSVLFAQVYGYLEHVVAAGTVPDIITWHELTHPESVRDSVETFRQWEREIFAGTAYEGTELPINVNEYAFNYHTSVPGQMIQWISAIEEAKVDAMIAFWNINGNLSDSAVQSNRANGQWWLYNAYSRMTGHTVAVTPPQPGENYTLQGVAALDSERALARVIVGGKDGVASVRLDDVPADLFGERVRVWVREIPWTGQLGDSAQPVVLGEFVSDVVDGGVRVDFTGDQLPLLTESSAYEVLVTPAGTAEVSAESPYLWTGSYEAEDAEYTGGGYSLNGPEGSPADVSRFYTSGGYNVGGLRTGSDGVLDFTVTVLEDGAYDLSVFANSLNTHDLVAEQGPTNVFLRVNGEAEQEVFLPLGYKWVVWDHTETTVELSAGENVISLAAESLDGEGATQGDVIIDRITLGLPNPEGIAAVYEAELAQLDGASPVYGAAAGAHASGSGAVELAGGEATFWVYSAEDAASELVLRTSGEGRARLGVNGEEVTSFTGSIAVPVHLSGGVNKVTVSGVEGSLLLDRLEVDPGSDLLEIVEFEAEEGRVAGEATVSEYSLASGGEAVTAVGGAPGNANTFEIDVEAPAEGLHAVTIRYSNPEQVPGTHYNPNPLGRHADISVNGGESQRVMFPPTFHENNFWEVTVPLELAEGQNTIAFRSEELPNHDGQTYASDTWPGILLRSSFAPIVDRLGVSPFAGEARRLDDGGEVPTEEPTGGETEEPTPDEEPTDDPTTGDPDGDGDSAGDGSGDGDGAGDGSSAPSDADDDRMASTGAAVLSLVLVAVALVAAGTLVVRRRAMSSSA